MVDLWMPAHIQELQSSAEESGDLKTMGALNAQYCWNATYVEHVFPAILTKQDVLAKIVVTWRHFICYSFANSHLLFFVFLPDITGKSS